MRRNRTIATAFFALAFLLSGAFAQAQETTSQSETTRAKGNATDSTTANATETVYATRVPTSLLSLGMSSGFYSPYAFVVDKKARTLTVWTQDPNGYKQLAEFPADLGKKDGDKTSSGDHKTPEGVYFLINRLEGPSLDFSQYGRRAYTTDYPNFFDRIDGKTGWGIWLHAVPDRVPLTRGSRGCVVVRNDAIMYLSQYVKLQKTPILIEPSIDYASSEEITSVSRQLRDLIQNWREAWQKKDIESYISFYGDEFKAMKMNREQWKRYKQNLNDRYQSFNVRFSRPILLRYKERIIARFLQDYTSDQYADFGEKTLYIKKTTNGFKIIGEDWREEKSQLAHDEINAGATSVTACVNDNTLCSAKTTSAAN